MFEKTVIAGWGDMDYNAHMRNTAYLDKAVDVRMMYFAEHGLPMSEFMRLQVGPVVMKDEVEYFREARLLDTLTVRLGLAGLSADGSRMLLRNEFFRGDTRIARVTSAGGWLDLATRKLIVPPEPLLSVMRALPHAEDFVVLPGSMK
jgi:acyl-CoA thioester hydrolase